MDRALLQQIWPIFSGEAREHLEAIGEGILALEDEPAAAGVLDRIRRTAHSLKGSAGSLGLGDVERLAHAIEGALAGYDPAEGLSRAAAQAALDAVEAMEEAIATGDGGGEPVVTALPAHLAALGAPAGAAGSRRPATSSGPAAPVGRDAAAEPGGVGSRPASLDGEGAPELPHEPGGPLALLDTLEHAVELLCSPVEPAGRATAAAEAVAAARRLAGQAGDRSADVERVAEAFGRIAQGGPEGARAAASLAGDLVALREAFERPAPAASAPAPAPAAPADKSIRVLASTLDSLGRQLELLAMSEARHARRAKELREAEGGLRDVVRALEGAARITDGEARTTVSAAVQRLRGLGGELVRLARDGAREADGQRLVSAVLREDLRALRMVPAGLALEPLRRTIRDVAGRLGKEVDLQLLGGDVKLDRRVVDELRDPLLHLVRNAADHGLEEADARRAAGKPARGRITVRVEPRGARVGLVVEDDGAGLDLAAVRGAAVRKGVLDAAAAERLSDAEAARLVFHPGLSTARAVTAISGRGVGLDVVQESLARLQGTVDVSFVPGQGTRFDLEVPLSVTASAAILFRVGRDLAALPADSVERVLLLTEGDVGTVAGRATVAVAGVQLAYATLSALLGAQAPPKPARLRPALVLVSGAHRVVVAVEEVLGQQELVISALGARAGKVAHLGGAAMLDDGRVVGVLNAPELVRRALPAAAGRASAAPERTRIVVADDALTTRFAMKAILEIAGFTVLPAADGEEAFQLLQASGARLLVSDVQMPRLDGLGLTRRVKGDPRLRATPVILVTSLDAPEDRAAGLEAGADGYLVKREVERGKLLELVRQLLPARA
jgi:two-component system, chemotaxis family, sensor kinase CheA